MLLIQRTLALYIPCCLLVALHGGGDAAAAATGKTPGKTDPPVAKPSSWLGVVSSWVPEVPQLPQLPEIINPLTYFRGSSVPATTRAPEKRTDRPPGRSGSDGATVEPPAAAATRFLTARPTPPTPATPATPATGVTPVTPRPEEPAAVWSTRGTAAQNDSDAVVSATDAPAGSSAEDTPPPPPPSTGSGRAGADPTEQATRDTRTPPPPPTSPPSSAVAPGTTVTTAWERTPHVTSTTTSSSSTTMNPGPVETAPGRRTPGSVTPSTSHRGTAPVTVPSTASTIKGVSFASAATEAEETPETPGSVTTTRSTEVTSQSPEESPLGGEEDGGRDVVVAGGWTNETSSAEISTATLKLPTTPGRLTTGDSPTTPPPPDPWPSAPGGRSAALLPDCNDPKQRPPRICDFPYTWEPATTTKTTKTPITMTTTNQTLHPLDPALLIPLHADWDSALAAWGLAWHAHVYGAGALFAAVAAASALNLLLLPLRCPSGCGYFFLVSVLLAAAGGAASFSLLYDAYGRRGRLPPAGAAALALREAPFPCLTASFGLVFLLLAMRSRMQPSYAAFRRPAVLACLVATHFAAAFAPAALMLHQERQTERQTPLDARRLLSLRLASRGAFVALAAFLSTAYFVFYACVRADSKHIYRLNNDASASSPTSPAAAARHNRRPFANGSGWERAAAAACVAALLSLACAGLQLYAVLRAAGVTQGGGLGGEEGEEEVSRPWPWWTYQVCCRACELGVCVTLALVVAQPVSFGGGGGCGWTELLATKSPMLPGTYRWTLNQQEKLAIVDSGLGLGLGLGRGLGLGETESLPLYTLVDERLGGSSLNGLDLLYHSNRALAYRDLDPDPDLDPAGSEKPDASGRSSLTSGSTADLRPPSPIDLRRSIDEALFPMSLFSSTGGDRDLDLAHLGGPGPPRNGGRSLFRRASPLPLPPPCVAAEAAPAAPASPSLSSSTTCSSPERWRGSSSSCISYRQSFGGSSLVLCPSPSPAEDQDHLGAGGGIGGGDHPQRRYHTLGSASQESLALDLDLSSEADRSLQEEFISVCRQMDASSVCSETIDL